MRSVKSQTTNCTAPSCNLISQVICHHCSQQFCQLCFMCHRKNILDDMQSISEQMSTNRDQGVSEVIAFIDKQAQDAHDQAKKLVDDAIDRIVKASRNIYAYIENRRQAKLSRLDECLEKFDNDAKVLEAKLKSQIFLSADVMLEFRRNYAYNMFENMIAKAKEVTELQRKNEKFFDDYRYYDELINLRKKWTFLQAALTTVYFPAKKDISLDKILTFLEYRHDRVLENYRDFLSTNEDSKELSLKPAEDLLHELSFLSKKVFLAECDNFTCLSEPVRQIEIDKDVKQENEITPKTDSGHGEDDETNSTSSQSWQIEDAEEDNDFIDDYDTRFMKLSQSMQQLEKQFQSDLQPFLKDKPID